MEVIEQLTFFIAVSAIAIICLKYPDLFVRFLTRNVSISDERNAETPAQDVARMVRRGSQEWKIKYPQLANFIKLVGYVAIVFLLVFLISVILSILGIA